MSNRIIGYTVVTKTFREMVKKRAPSKNVPETQEITEEAFNDGSVHESGSGTMNPSRIKKSPRGHNGTTICHCNRKKSTGSSQMSEGHLLSIAEAQFSLSLQSLVSQFREPLPGEFVIDFLEDENQGEEEGEGEEVDG